jgi:Xaa-Pro dipeptidase
LSSSSFDQHIRQLQAVYEQAVLLPELQATGVEAVLLHSGRESYYYADDRAILFQAYGHFCQWLPVNRPDQFVLFCPGEKPLYYQIVPSDFWYEQSISLPATVAEAFEVITLDSVTALREQLPKHKLAYLGEAVAVAESLGINSARCNPRALVHYLDYRRAYKTAYELEQLRSASERALLGHRAARDCFLKQGNEYDIHMAYLAASGQLEDECPYTNIVALDEKSAILHYQNKRRQPADKCQVLLIDAGCRVNGYCSDITRTWTKSGTHPVFQQLLKAMDALEQELVGQVKPGMLYPELHQAALRGIAGLLEQLGICTASANELMERQVAQLFMPHGVGHLLGIQVHDVAGHQLNSDGELRSAPAHSPALRNTREMAVDMVFTVEPGCYFIPMLLEPERATARGEVINWSMVEALYPCGGIRIEDNIRVTANGAENLTRQFDIL